MLINATQHEELRVAIIKNNKLYDLDIERRGAEQKKANIYKGRITHIEPSLGAAFVDYGAERHGFLPLKEVARSYFRTQPPEESLSQVKIQDVLKEGQELMVQVEKEERGTKGAALTTFIGLAGSFLVLMPNNPRAGGISRRIEGEDRQGLRELLSKLNIPEGMGVIIRTVGLNKSLEDLQWDLDSLILHWEAIQAASQERPAPFLIHKESDVIMRAVRDYLRPDMQNIIIDEPETYEKVKQYIQQTMPKFVETVKLYQNKTPLFSRYQIEKQIETAYKRTVNLSSGGSIVIDPTEALVSIDVNSAKATSGKDIEETAFNTNLEAAEEIARQLRLRDIGGLIVIDFIDMTPIENQRKVAEHLREMLKGDRARVKIGNITRFGLMEMSRQRLRPRLGEAIQVACPRCDGQGTIRNARSLATSIIRLIEEAAAQEKIVQVQAQLPIDLATYLINEKRDVLKEIETRQNVRVLIIPNQYIKIPKYTIKSLTLNELPKGARNIPSYKLIAIPKVMVPTIGEAAKVIKSEEPAVKQLRGKSPFPAKKKKAGFFKRVSSLFGGGKKVKSQPKTQTKRRTSYQTKSSQARHYRKIPSARRGTRGGRQRVR